MQVSAAAKCSQQLQSLSTAFGRDQGSPEELQTQCLGEQGHNSSLFNAWGTFLCLAHLPEPKKASRENV